MRSGIFYRVVMPVAIVAACVLTYYLVFHAPRRGVVLPSPEQKEPAAPEAKIEVGSPEVKHFRDGKQVWSLRAGEIHVVEGESVLNDASASILIAGGRTLNFTAPRTLYASDTKDIRIEGPAVGTIAPDGYSFTSKGLGWEGRDEHLRATGVAMTFGENSIRADTLEAAPGSDTVEMRGNVEIDIPLELKHD